VAKKFSVFIVSIVFFGGLIIPSPQEMQFKVPKTKAELEQAVKTEIG